MNKDFEKELKEIEAELTDLKTASEYSSVRSAAVTYSQTVYTGVYRITYENRGEPIFSFIHTGIIEDEEDLGGAMPRTPSGNVQLVDVSTTFINTQFQPVTRYTTMVVVSNVPVVSIERIS